MKILLVAINAKYIHSNPAVYSLKAYAERALQADPEDLTISVASFTINQHAEDIREAVYLEHPDVLAVSCYIWNIALVADLIPDWKKLLPKTDIWLGGPEVSWNAGDYLRRFPQVRGIMEGEGEKTFAKLCGAYLGRWDFSDIRGICCRAEQAKTSEPNHDISVEEREPEEPLSMDELPFLYEDLEPFAHKIIYYETSRGCPFSCSYCLSSVDKKLRFRSLELVFRELSHFLEHKVAQVKFVDRTFNCNRRHAMAIWTYIREHDNGITNFHFEIAADLLREEELSLLSSMRPGLVQLEIGVQSTNPQTLAAIRRVTDLERLRYNAARLKENGNVHCHLDLIAGLPYEGFESFRRSFCDVYAMEPEQLQLGFLKVLYGSPMKEEADSYGTVYSSRPPYEVLSTKWLSHDELLRLKAVEEMVETYYNSGQFSHTLAYAVRVYGNSFDFYEALAEHYRSEVPAESKVNRRKKYEILFSFLVKSLPQKEAVLREWLVFDYYLRENAKSRPSFADDLRLYKEELQQYYRQFSRGADVHVERFVCLNKFLCKEKQASAVYVAFDYRERNPLNKEARWRVMGD